MNAYTEESRALDAEVCAVIEAWRSGCAQWSENDFNALALRMFAYQMRYNVPYARYVESLPRGRRSPRRWDEIPPVPAASFRDADLTTGTTMGAAVIFETSGTTRERAGRHFLENTRLYDAALIAGFEHAMLGDGARLRYCNLVPNPAQSPHSSLGYMMARVSEHFGDARTGWYLRDGAIALDAFQHDIRGAQEAGVPVLLAGTAFAFVHLTDHFDQKTPFVLPPGSRIMETGGFKGRSRTIERSQLYERLSRCFGVAEASIVSEYGMTELSSQYYDSFASRTSRRRIKRAPPWLRARIVDERNDRVPAGTIGSLVHVDLANRSSALCVATEDLGAHVDDGFVLLGREAGSELRGCSLAAEELRAG